MMRPHLMIIDDSVDQLRLMTMVFRMVSPRITIETAENGADALAKLRAPKALLPKVILLDLRMPGMSGHEVLSQIKTDPHLKLIPVCTFSNSVLDEDIGLSYDRGAAFYFKKPEGLEELKVFIEHFNAIWYQFASLYEPA